MYAALATGNSVLMVVLMAWYNRVMATDNDWLRALTRGDNRVLASVTLSDDSRLSAESLRVVSGSRDTGENNVCAGLFNVFDRVVDAAGLYVGDDNGFTVDELYTHIVEPLMRGLYHCRVEKIDERVTHLQDIRDGWFPIGDNTMRPLGYDGGCAVSVLASDNPSDGYMIVLRKSFHNNRITFSTGGRPRGTKCYELTVTAGPFQPEELLSLLRLELLITSNATNFPRINGAYRDSQARTIGYYVANIIMREYPLGNDYSGFLHNLSDIAERFPMIAEPLISTITGNIERMRNTSRQLIMLGITANGEPVRAFAAAPVTDGFTWSTQSTTAGAANTTVNTADTVSGTRDWTSAARVARILGE